MRTGSGEAIPKLILCAKAQEDIVIKHYDNEVNDMPMNGDLGSANSQDDDDAESRAPGDGIEVLPDATMIDATSAEVVMTISLPSGKECPARSAFSNHDTDDFITLGGAPC